MANDRTQPGVGDQGRTKDTRAFTEDMRTLSSALEFSPHLPKNLFDSVVNHLQEFPKYEGPAEGKGHIKVATFGNNHSRAEIDLSSNHPSVTVTYLNLDANRLQQLAASGSLNAAALETCFQTSPTQHRLEITIGSQGQEDSVKIISFDVGKKAFVEGQIFQPFEQAKAKRVNELLADKAEIIPYFLFRLRGKSVPRATMEELHFQQLQKDQERRTGRQFGLDEDLIKRPRYYYPEEPVDWVALRRSWSPEPEIFSDQYEPAQTYDFHPNRVIPEPTVIIKPAEGPPGYKHKDSEDDRNAYWKAKNAKTKKNQVKTKHAAKKKK